MAHLVPQHWEASDTSGLLARDRKSGSYHCYFPDKLMGLPIVINRELDELLSRAERAVRSLDDVDQGDLAGVSRFLLRSEAIASSRIEGIAPAPPQIALAELAQSEDIQGVSEQAILVANNMTVVNRARHELIHAETVKVDDVVRLHSALLPKQPQLHHLRTSQNWIGGSDWHPLDAEFIPPPPGEVLPLMVDLMTYLNGAAHSPIIQAALVHAQFETIHPFGDGNGRVGRALIHTVLSRRGLLETAVLPVSQVLATLSNTYISGLTAFRFTAEPHSEEAQRGVNTWVTVFTNAVLTAADQAQQLMCDLADMRAQWCERLRRHRESQGTREMPRSDSATAKILRSLTSTPVLTARTAQEIHRMSHPAVNSALLELEGAGIVKRKKVNRNAYAYIAQDVLSLITLSERALASTRFNTLAQPPARAVPAAPNK